MKNPSTIRIAHFLAFMTFLYTLTRTTLHLSELYFRVGLSFNFVSFHFSESYDMTYSLKASTF